MKNSERPAMPIAGDEDIIWSETEYGLTKREYFAAMAMQGILSRQNLKGTSDDYAIVAIAAADALLKELER